MDDSNAHIGDNNKGSAGDRSQGHTDTLMQAPGDTIMHMLAAITQSTEAQNTVTAPSPPPPRHIQTHSHTLSRTVTHSHTLRRRAPPDTLATPDPQEMLFHF